MSDYAARGRSFLVSEVLRAHLSGLVVERADTTLANRIGWDVEITAECAGDGAVEGLFQRCLGGGCDGWLEEAGAKGAVDLHDGRDPRCVALGGVRSGTFKVLAEARGEAAKLSFVLLNKAGADIVLVGCD